MLTDITLPCCILPRCALRDQYRWLQPFHRPGHQRAKVLQQRDVCGSSRRLPLHLPCRICRGALRGRRQRVSVQPMWPCGHVQLHPTHQQLPLRVSHRIHRWTEYVIVHLLWFGVKDSSYVVSSVSFFNLCPCRVFLILSKHLMKMHKTYLWHFIPFLITNQPKVIDLNKPIWDGLAVCDIGYKRDFGILEIL